MTDRERILAVLAGRRPDRMPWIPRLLLWYNAHARAGTLPDRYRGMTLREVERDLGVGTPARDGRVFTTRLPADVTARERQISPTERRTETVTPLGTVSTLHRRSAELHAAGIEDMQAGFWLKTAADYPIVEYILTHTKYVPAYADYTAYDAQIGDEGYPMVQVGDCPFHRWMRELVGYNNAFYHLSDYRDEVEQLLAALDEYDRRVVWPILADSPAQLILHGVHHSSQMTPPRLYDRYILPYYRDLSALLRSRGKTLALHADNDTRHILTRIEAAGFGMAECFVTAPMVPTTLAEARAAWGDRVIIWGGVPSVILEPQFSDAEFEAYVREIFEVVGDGAAFILGVADNVMPGAEIERVRRITEMVSK